MDPGRAHAPGASPPQEAITEDAPPAFPWHLKLLLVAVVVYLGYRAFEMAGWLWDRVA